MQIEPKTQAQILGELIFLITGTSFIVIGTMAILVALIRRRAPGVLAVFWLGIWSCINGLQRLNECSFVIALLPRWVQACVPYSHALATYLTLVAGALTFRELTLGKARQFATLLALAALLIAIFGVGRFVLSGGQYTLLGLNNAVAAVGIVVFLACFIVPSLGRKYTVINGRGIVLAGTIFFCLQALLTNALSAFGYLVGSIWGDLGLFVLLLTLGYVAIRRINSSELRLSAIENELAIARQLQFSILPAATPEISNLRIAAAYEPMTAVAGDFYEYLPVDDHRVGFLVADVSGHGVPAALIAAMIKVAAQSVAAFADNPSELLRRLRDVLSAQLREQFVSAAYLWIDTSSRTARYSAAGHPPLFFWHAADESLQHIESNGLLLGVPIESVFPTREIAFASGDRFLLYTDGFSEPENAAGEPFADHQVEQTLRTNSSSPAAELSLLLLSKLRAWQPTSIPQQDDITMLVIDVL